MIHPVMWLDVCRPDWREEMRATVRWLGESIPDESPWIDLLCAVLILARRDARKLQGPDADEAQAFVEEWGAELLEWMEAEQRPLPADGPRYTFNASRVVTTRGHRERFID